MKILKLFGILSLLIFGAIAAGGAYVYTQIPTEAQIKGCMVTTMYKVNLCPGSKDYVPLKSISKYVQQAVIITEDSSFYDHDGFDWKSIEDNAKKNMEKGTYAKGGSTITQQLAKNLFLYKDKTLLRKGLEALITQKIEQTLTKKEILERYLNVVEFGNEIYGVKQASAFYFKKAPANLNVVESAFLAMVLPNPKKYSQSYFKKELTPFAHKRLQKIAGDMHRYGRINDEEFDLALNQIAGFFSPALLSDDYGISELGDDAATVEQDSGGTTLDELENLDAFDDTE